MAGLITVKIEIPTVTQYVATSPVVTFREVIDINAHPPSVTARIIGYSYNVGGAANDARLVLTPAGSATGTDEDIILENRLTANSEAVNSFTDACGPQGRVVPRRYGIEATAQPPALPADGVTSAETYQVFFSTLLKDANGTFYLWYVIDGLEAGS